MEIKLRKEKRLLQASPFDESGNVVEYILEYFNAAHASFVCSGICSHITVMAEHQITHLFWNIKNGGNFVYPKKEGRVKRRRKRVFEIG